VLYKKLEQCVEGMNVAVSCKKIKSVKCLAEGAEDLKELFIFAAVCYQILMTFIKQLISLVE
jgi:hypothetical protein